jgi:predicted kinase
MIAVPESALVLLIGASGSGKSSFALRHFEADAVVSSDRLRGVLTGEEANQQATAAAFRQLHQWLEARLAAGALAVVDATNTDWMRRAELIKRARYYQRPAIAIAFDLPLEICLARNAARPRTVRSAVIRRQHDALRGDLERLDLEGYSAVHIMRSVSDVDAVALGIERGPVSRALPS